MLSLSSSIVPSCQAHALFHSMFNRDAITILSFLFLFYLLPSAVVSESILSISMRFFSYSSFLFSTCVLSALFILSLAFVLHLFLFLFRLIPKVSGRDLLLVEESCNAPRPMLELPSIYFSLLSCVYFVCCIIIIICIFHSSMLMP